MSRLRTVIGWDKSDKAWSEDPSRQAMFPKGEPIFLGKGGTHMEFQNSLESVENANGDISGVGLGYQRVTDTLTYLKKLITVPKYYEVNIADYLPVVIGEGAFADDILTHLTINSSGDFEDGIIDQGIDNAMLAKVNAGISSVTVPVVTWAKTVSYTQPEIEQAMFANNWNVINAKHESRQINWELGIQQLAFLGSRNRAGVYGLLTLPNVNVGPDIIPVNISAMDVTQFFTLIAQLYEAYRLNCNRTAKPNRFVMPEDDFNGLMVAVSQTYPNVMMADWLEEGFKKLGLSGMQILPSAYGMAEYNTAYGLGFSRYALYNYEESSLRMDIPVNIRSTMPGTLNNFQFQDAAWAMFTGAYAYRELEVLYFDHD